MAIDGFDYKEFSNNLTEQAKSLLPGDLVKKEKDYVIKTIENFSFLAGESVYNDNSLNFDADKAIFMTQVVAEWTFHKCIDLIHSGIPNEYWDSVMQKIAFNIYEVTKEGLIKNLAENTLLDAIEYHVNKSYYQAVEELHEKESISDEIYEKALSVSNIDDMANYALRSQEINPLIEKQKTAETKKTPVPKI